MYSKSSQKSIAVVQPRNDKGLDEKLCSMLRKEGHALSDVISPVNVDLIIT